jgi:hypothetical protein
LGAAHHRSVQRSGCAHAGDHRSGVAVCSTSAGAADVARVTLRPPRVGPGWPWLALALSPPRVGRVGWAQKSEKGGWNKIAYSKIVNGLRAWSNPNSAESWHTPYRPLCSLAQLEVRRPLRPFWRRF